MKKIDRTTRFIIKAYKVDSGEQLSERVELEPLKAIHKANTLREPYTTIFTQVVDPSLDYRYQEIDEDIQNGLYWGESRNVGK